MVNRHRVFGGRVGQACFFAAMVTFAIAVNAQNFREVDDYGWSRGINNAAPAIIDIDGNGLLDLIVGSENHGLGRWEQTSVNSNDFRRIAREFIPRTHDSQWAPLFVDLNGNGRRDLLLGVNGGYVPWYEETDVASGEFEKVMNQLPEITFGAVGRLWFGDLDGDGKQDLLIGTAQRMTHHFIQRSANSENFDRASDLRYSDPPQYYHQPLIADLDGDGQWEMLTGGQDRKIRLYRQDAAVKDSFILINAEWSGITDAENTVSAIIDIDADGLLDMFVGTKAGLVRQYEQPSAGALDGWQLRNENVLNTWDFGFRNTATIIDLDGDGRLDILRTEVPIEVEGNRLPIQLFRQRKQGTFDVAYVGTFSGVFAGIYEYLAFTDLEGDGLLDFFVTRLNGGMEHYRQKSGEPFTFELVTDHFLPSVEFVFPPFPAFVDLDGNGRLDLILAQENNVIDRYEADAPGSLNFSLVMQNWRRARYYQPAICFFDYDNNGKLDMLEGGAPGTLTHYEQDDPGSTQFSSVQSPLSNITTGYQSQPMVHDVNHDGRLDVVVADGAGGISLFIDEGPAAVEAPGAAATVPLLLAPYPQPASSQLFVPFLVYSDAPVRISVHDLWGREWLRPVDGGILTHGRQLVQVSTATLAGGVYFIRMLQGMHMQQRAIIIRR
ncbi:MAG: VCBS repeat-containing protein [Bacteroidetes bacterium]|nr:VCBS repeat-containing protein [Bacteroidota bacterium]